MRTLQLLCRFHSVPVECNDTVLWCLTSNTAVSSCVSCPNMSQHVPTKTFTSTSTWQLLTSHPFALRHLKDMVEVLLAAKASVDVPCSDGATALILASQVCRLNGLDGLASGFWRLEFHRSVRWI